jgi:hypothetical protein
MRFLSRVTAFAAITLTLMTVGGTQSWAADSYELTIVTPAVGGSPIVYRIDVATGKVSNVSASPAADVGDPQAIPAGAYQLYVSETPDNKSYWLYRLETETGRTWFYSNNSWTEIK